MIFQCLLIVLCHFLLPTDSIEAPALQKPLMIPAELRIGERADIICTLRRGDLPVTFKWFFNGREIRGEELGKVTSYDVRSSVYLMDKLRAENVGNYTCTVSNAAGSDTASGQLLVEGE
ncbi:ig-like domain-containing protein [Nephila pilipes]|uniref:Ig-like domain-containing protein n=1 Tax=Nephila pilipes TaxID=299642 RepID=A0A8X6NW31_NEPPI|nr:ig-like domain-containing protein [Nephila pilipes]